MVFSLLPGRLLARRLRQSTHLKIALGNFFEQIVQLDPGLLEGRAQHS